MTTTSKGIEIKVGLFVFFALLLLVYMSLQVGKGGFFVGETYDIVVYFDNVTGLRGDAPVEIAGIEVGRVTSIELEEGRAKVALALKPGVQVFGNAEAVIRTRGVLGDKFVELKPGTSSYPPLAEGGTVPRAATPPDLDQLFQRVGQIADDIGTVASSVSNVLGGQSGEADMRAIVENLRDMSIALNSIVQQNMESINELVLNMRDFSKDLREISGENKDSINVIVQNMEVASKDLRSTLASLNTVMQNIEKGDGTLNKIIADEEMGTQLKETVASLESVSRKIDEGQGSLGKLVNDPKAAEELEKALEGLNTYLSAQERFRTTVDFTPEVLTRTGDIKTYLNLKLQPVEDRYYMFSLVSSPEGRTEKTDTTTKTYVNGEFQGETYEEETKQKRYKILFSAQIAKRWRDLVLRGGIIESTGGLGVDYYFWDDRLQVFFEAFDFDADDPAHLKSGARLFFLRNFYVSAGFDDFISDQGNSSFFAGLGLYFTDEDLKLLVSNAPLPGS